MLGITLRYDGSQFHTNGKRDQSEAKAIADESALVRTSTKDGASHATQFQNLFSAVGALVMRYNLGFRQRAALLQQTSMRDEEYKNNPVQNVAKGGDENGLFAPKEDGKTYSNTMLLCLIAHSTLGKSKVVNDRGQPAAAVNKHNLGGEQRLWDVIHSAVWQAGISLPYALDDQKFRYLACPENVSPEDYDKIVAEMEAGHYEKASGSLVKLYNLNYELEICSFKEIEINANPNSRYSTSLSITRKGQSNNQPAGFVIDGRGKVLPHDHADGLFKVIKVAKGGTLLMTDEEQNILLTGGFLSKNTAKGQALFTQNITFNAMVPIFSDMEKATGFSVLKAMQKNASLAAKRLQEEIQKSPDAADDFLVGSILTEMVQPLKKSSAAATRSLLPTRFSNSHPALLNNTKAIVRAFGLKDAKGQELMVADKGSELSENPALIDVQINGQLKKPDLTRGKHLAAIVATAILTTEQLIVEIVIRDALKMQGESLPLLKDILGSDSAEGALMLAHDIPADKLGRQFKESDEVVALVRDSLGTDHLIKLADQMHAHNEIAPDAVTLQAFKKLQEVGEMLQNYDGTSGRSEESRGILAGMGLVAEKLPEYTGRNSFIQSLYKRLEGVMN